MEREDLGLGRWWSRLVGGAQPRPPGAPTRRSQASSFHFWWGDDARLFVEVAATLEVVRPPVFDRLYFWALQVSFVDDGRRVAGGHLGLQWNPRHPGHGAVNWGGYAAQALGGGILDGSPSALPSSRNDRNTRDYPWQPGRPYRLRVHPAPGQAGAWRGEVTDLTTGEAAVVRDLHGGGDRLVAPVVWSEVFAECGDPSVAVRWSDLVGVTADGEQVATRAGRVNYQPTELGGCPNTNTTVDTQGVLQTTNTSRTTPQGTLLTLAQV